MPAPLQPLVQSNFSGGVNLASNPYALSKKHVWRINNLILDEHGSLRTRPGYATIATAPHMSDVIYNGVYNQLAGSPLPFAITRGDGVSNGFYLTNQNPWALIGTFTTDYQTPQTIAVLNKILIAPGYETPKTFDGTSLANITSSSGAVPLGARHAAFHLGAVWLWNTASTTGALDGPSSLRASATNDVGDWPAANQAFVSKDDGQTGQGLAIFTIAEAGISPLSTLILFKDYSAYQVTGVFGSSNFAVQKTKSDLGCIAPRTIQFVSGFGIIRLSHKGFALFDGVNDRLISEEVRPALFGLLEPGSETEYEILPIDWTQTTNAWAGQVQNPPLYVAALPVEGTTGLTRLFLYDLVRKAWTICTLPITLASIRSVYETNLVRLLGGTKQGTVVRLFDTTDITDDGEPISWSFRTRPAHTGNPTGTAYWRRFLIDLAYVPEQSVNVTATLIGILGEDQKTFKAPVLLSEGTSELGINKVSNAVYADISGTGNVRIRSCAWHGRSKPLSGPRKLS